MNPIIWLGRGREIMEFSESTWKEHLTQVPQHSQTRLSFMSAAHHQVRYFVVRELVKRQRPIQPEEIAAGLDMPRAVVAGILDELEQKLFFLVRNGAGAVAWAYPVTVEPTPHRLAFSSGERLYGA